MKEAISSLLNARLGNLLVFGGLVALLLGLVDVEDISSLDLELRGDWLNPALVMGILLLLGGAVTHHQDEQRASIPSTLDTSADLQVPIPAGVSEDRIRVSISALCRIKEDGKYLLVRGGRNTHQLQPVGGVLKRLSLSKPLLEDLEILDDDGFQPDRISAGDLRVRVPTSKLGEFLAWYGSQIGRELDPWREFYEELLRPPGDGTDPILAADDFPHVQFQWVKRHVNGIKYTEHFKCHELLIAEIFEPDFTPEQVIQLRGSQNRESYDFAWATAKEIELGQVEVRGDTTQIAPTATWTL
ncbi:MAG: hypothetical protein AAGA65_16570 [Actinomycetota bacterium]